MTLWRAARDCGGRQPLGAGRLRDVAAAEEE